MPGPLGSSPLTQGKRCMILPTGRPVRLIPTHAGKTAGSFPEWSPFGAHPRSRGENASAVSAAYPASGSSPLTRGKRGVRGVCDPWTRLIHAHAGRTPRRSPPRTRRRAHPHSRGENEAFAGCAIRGRGSSPLTRGKLCEAGGGERRVGLIPAHAGKTQRVGMCAFTSAGSSPLTRGKQRGG